MTQALTDRVNSLDLSADLKQVVWEKPLSSAEWSQEVVGRIKDELLMLEEMKTEFKKKSSLSSCPFKVEKTDKQIKLDPQPPVLVFHENCGDNIRLTNGNRTAEKTELNTFSYGVVVSRDPMLANVLYEVRVDTVTGGHNALALGVTRISPARLTVTLWSRDLQDSVIIMPAQVFHQGESAPTPLAKELWRLEVGSRVGVLVTSSNDLHLYINGQDQGVAAKNVTQPCFAVFSIGRSVTKVTALPTSRRT